MFVMATVLAVAQEKTECPFTIMVNKNTRTTSHKYTKFEHYFDIMNSLKFYQL